MDTITLTAAANHSDLLAVFYAAHDGAPTRAQMCDWLIETLPETPDTPVPSREQAARTVSLELQRERVGYFASYDYLSVGNQLDLTDLVTQAHFETDTWRAAARGYLTLTGITPPDANGNYGIDVAGFGEEFTLILAEGTMIAARGFRLAGSDLVLPSVTAAFYLSRRGLTLDQAIAEGEVEYVDTDDTLTR